MITDQPIVLAESPINMLLLAVIVLVSITAFVGKRVTAVHGVTHLIVFLVFGLAIFA